MRSLVIDVSLSPMPGGIALESHTSKPWFRPLDGLKYQWHMPANVRTPVSRRRSARNTFPGKYVLK